MASKRPVSTSARTAASVPGRNGATDSRGSPSDSACATVGTKTCPWPTARTVRPTGSWARSSGPAAGGPEGWDVSVG
ncbi:hypothetical protein IU11_09435 [Cellulosimicrobium sp. MM]|nr:hypothetical protein IU11_09435 [Cellulosimicrobium sp. MM]